MRLDLTKFQTSASFLRRKPGDQPLWREDMTKVVLGSLVPEVCANLWHPGLKGFTIRM